MNRLHAAGALILLVGTAHAYPVDINVVTRGNDVEATHVQEGQGTIIRLHNHDPVELRCAVLFDAGVENRRRTAIVPGGKSVTVAYTPRREVVRMRVRIECNPTEDEG